MRITRRLLIAAAILGSLFLGANVAAERIAESRIASEAQKSFGTPEPPAVSIEGFPILLQILQGRIPRATLEGSNLVLQDLRIARLVLQLERVSVSLSDLSAGKPVGVGRGLAVADVSEQSVNEYVRDRGHQVALDVQPGRLVASADVARVGRATAAGVPRLVGRVLSFRPERVTVAGRALSGAPLRQAQAALSFDVDIPVLPGGVRITSVELVEGTVRLVARLENATIDLA